MKPHQQPCEISASQVNPNFLKLIVKNLAHLEHGLLSTIVSAHLVQCMITLLKFSDCNHKIRSQNNKIRTLRHVLTQKGAAIWWPQKELTVGPYVVNTWRSSDLLFAVKISKEIKLRNKTKKKGDHIRSKSKMAAVCLST